MAVEQGAHVEDELAQVAPASGKDRGLAWYLALGVLRRRSVLDAALRPHLRQPIASMDAPVRAALRLGAFERLFARTAVHAAVDQSVEVAKALRAGRAKGLVNAVVRKVELPTGLKRADQLCHPAWLVSRWDKRYGKEATTEWCTANNEEPPVFAVTRNQQVTEFESTATDVDGVFRTKGLGLVTQLPGFAEGSFWIQDKAAVRIADIVGDVDGKRVLDACAAPGGKSFRLASRGGAVTAVDVSTRRLRDVVSGAERLNMDVQTAVHDWTLGHKQGLGEFDSVLVDVPCTGLGTLRRHPEIRWRRQLIDILSIPPKQGAILAGAATHVRPGGTLVYAVCSPEPEEGPNVVQRFVKLHPEFSLDTELGGKPPTDDEDVHYAARLTRKGA